MARISVSGGGGASAGQVGGLPVTTVLGTQVDLTVSSTALQNITGLTFTIGASATELWWVTYFIEFTSANATMDIKLGFAALPAAATMKWGQIGVQGLGANFGWVDFGTGTTATAIGTVASTYATGSGTAASTGVNVAAKVFGGGTAGTVQIMAAQNTSDVGQLSVLVGSHLQAWQLRA